LSQRRGSACQWKHFLGHHRGPSLGPSGDALVFADCFACYRVPSPPRVVSISVRGRCLPESIGNDIEISVLVHDLRLPSPDVGGSFPWTCTIHLRQKRVPGGASSVSSVNSYVYILFQQTRFLSDPKKTTTLHNTSYRNHTRIRKCDFHLSSPHTISPTDTQARTTIPPLKSPRHPKPNPNPHPRPKIS
jgi:hypothetical protein